MAVELKPTKTRLALLQAVDDGAVKKHFGIFPSRDYAEWDRGPGWNGPGRRYLTVTKRVEELWVADLVRLGVPDNDRYKASRRFELTQFGRALLDGAS